MLLLPCMIPFYQAGAPTAQLLQLLAAKVSYLQSSPEDCPWLMETDSTENVEGVMPRFLGGHPQPMTN